MITSKDEMCCNPESKSPFRNQGKIIVHESDEEKNELKDHTEIAKVIYTIHYTDKREKLKLQTATSRYMACVILDQTQTECHEVESPKIGLFHLFY